MHAVLLHGFVDILEFNVYMVKLFSFGKLAEANAVHALFVTETTDTDQGFEGQAPFLVSYS